MHRRAVLGAIGTAAAGLLAGCSGVPGLGTGDGGSGEDGGGDGGDGDSADAFDAAARWAIAPDDPTIVPASYEIRTLTPAAAIATDDRITATGVREDLGAASLAWRRLDPRSMDRTVEVRTAGHAAPERYRVFEGDLDPARVTDAFVDGPEAAAIGRYSGYERYDTGGAGWAYAIGQGRIVEIDRRRETTDVGDQLARIVEAGAGDADRITAVHEGMRDVAGRLEPGHWASASVADPDSGTDVRRGQFEGAVASGATARRSRATARRSATSSASRTARRERRPRSRSSRPGWEPNP